MTIEKIKEKLTGQKGQILYFKFNGARNQTEEFSGKIIETYPGVFIIQLKDDSNVMKSFSYADVLTLHLEIKEER